MQNNDLRANSYVPLNRGFLRYSGESNLEANAEQTYRSFYFRAERTWDEIEEHRYVVVLGEPGSGKTQEFLARALHHKKLGRFAHFLRIEELANESIKKAIPYRQRKAIEAMEVTDQGYLFLDSVDEARLSSADAFPLCQYRERRLLDT